jgi:molybdopterin-guanine dinucleotide biosynthesis protein MobB
MKNIPVVGLAGFSGSGKTTFLEKLIAELKSRGYRLGVIKHTHHKETRQQSLTGAAVEVLAGPQEVFLNRKYASEPSPEEVISMIDGVDLILIEGYKRGRWPKLVIFREGVTERPEINPEDFLAEISDAPTGSYEPHFDLDNASGVADLLEQVIIHRP